MARITAETQRAQKKTTTGLRQRHRETEKQEKTQDGGQAEKRTQQKRERFLPAAGRLRPA